jgi:hypothetical protein
VKKVKILITSIKFVGKRKLGILAGKSVRKRYLRDEARRRRTYFK